ncbi:4387_t:CDS:2, partial [Diversispora eburnea]
MNNYSAKKFTKYEKGIKSTFKLSFRLCSYAHRKGRQFWAKSKDRPNLSNDSLNSSPFENEK